jgi:hypothetical protein
MPTADAAKYGAWPKAMAILLSGDVAPLKQTSLHRLMIKLTDIRNVLNVIEEMPWPRSSSTRRRRPPRVCPMISG